MAVVPMEWEYTIPRRRQQHPKTTGKRVEKYLRVRGAGAGAGASAISKRNRINRAQNAHVILGVPAGASRATIRRAFLTLSKKFHPDKGGNANTFRKIKNAYDKLRK